MHAGCSCVYRGVSAGERGGSDLASSLGHSDPYTSPGNLSSLHHLTETD